MCHLELCFVEVMFAACIVMPDKNPHTGADCVPQRSLVLVPNDTAPDSPSADALPLLLLVALYRRRMRRDPPVSREGLEVRDHRCFPQVVRERSESSL